MESRLEFVQRIFISEQRVQISGSEGNNFVVPFIFQFSLAVYLASFSELP